MLGGLGYRNLVADVRNNTAKLRYIVNVKDPAYGAKGDSVTDDTTAIHLARDAVKAAGGKIYFPPGTYKTTTGLNFDDVQSGVSLEGDGSQAQSTMAATITYSGAAGNLLTGKSSLGLSLRNLRFAYTNAAFASDLISFGQSGGLGNDAMYARIDQCVFEGVGASGARSLIALDKTIISSIRRSLFRYSDTAVLLASVAAGTYAVDIDIEYNTFLNQTTQDIKIGGTLQTLRIAHNTFEPLVSGKCGCINQDFNQVLPRGFEITNNWVGDVTVDGGTAFRVAGFGMAIIGNRVTTRDAGVVTNICMEIPKACTGVVIKGNDFAGNIGIKISDTVTDADIAANSYTCTTNLSGAASLSNSRYQSGGGMTQTTSVTSPLIGQSSGSTPGILNGGTLVIACPVRQPVLLMLSSNANLAQCRLYSVTGDSAANLAAASISDSTGGTLTITATSPNTVTVTNTTGFTIRLTWGIICFTASQ